MNKYIKTLLPMAIFCAFGVALIWFNESSPARGQSNPSGQGEAAPSFARINERARAVKGRRDDSVRGLADDVFNTFGLDQAPAADVDALKERLGRAEVKYQQGRKRGVSERDVVGVINGLAKKFDAPQYAKTDLHEIRNLRVSMISYLPQFVAQEQPGKESPKKAIGSTINPEMSPLEAAYIAMLLVRQKQYNPDFQVTPKERAAQWAEKHNGRQVAAVRGQAQAQLVSGRSPRQREMEQVLDRGISTMSIDDLLGLAHRSLDFLGIER